MPLVPKFSFVATSRNDDHGGDVLRRTQSFVDRLAEQCVRHRVHSELVLVDWNPPRSRKPLAEVLGWPAGSAWFSARVITVSPALHRRLECSRRLAMFQMIAKNVGIRRALGDYVIATNIDIIFSDALFEWLKSGAMREGVLYRSDRWDIPNEIQLEPDLDRLLQRARDEAIRHNLKDGTYVRRDGAFRNISAPRFDGSFYQPLENLLGGLRGSLADDDPVSPNKILPALDRMLSTDLPRLRREFLVPILHTNACGDFTMMAGHDWFALRGYPEWNIFSWHINSVIVYQAHYNNLQIGQLECNAVHYHIEHDYGSGWTPEGAGSLWARLSERGIPFISHNRFYELVFEMQDNAEKGAPTIYNDADWGFDGDALDCQTVVEEGSRPRAPATVNEAPLDEDFLKQLVPAALTIGLDAVEPVTDGIPVERWVGQGGGSQLAVETLPAMWSYAVALDLANLTACTGEYWIRLSIIVDSGNVELGVLNRAGSDFLMRATCPAAGTQAQPVVAHIEDIGRASRLILRNITPGDRPARFRITAIELLREDPEDAAMEVAARPDATAHNGPEVLPATPVPDDRAPAFASVGPLIADLRPGAADAIVSILRGAPAETDADRDCQAMIILPARSAEIGVVLDLGVLSPTTHKIAAHVHVLEGDVAIGLHARITGEPPGRAPRRTRRSADPRRSRAGRGGRDR